MDRKKYEVAMELLDADGEWYRMPRWVFRIQPNGKKLPAGVAHTLAAILHQSSYQKAVAQKDGWLDFSHDRAEEDTGYCERQQLYHIKKLAEHGLVQRRREDKRHGKRQLRIVYPVLVELMDQAAKSYSRKDCTSAKIAEPAPQRLRESILIEGKSTEENCRRKESSGGEKGLFSSNPPPSEGKQFAEELYKHLLKHRKISERDYNPVGWARRFTEAIRDHGFAMVRLAMDKYKLHFTEQFMTKAYAANTFCQKIPRIIELAGMIEAKEKQNTRRVIDHIDYIKQPDGTVTPKIVHRYEKLLPGGYR